MASSSRVAVVGFAQSQVERHAASTLGALAVDTARRAIADAGLAPKDVDGFVTASLFPSAGAHAAVDGVSLVSAHWMAAHLGVNPNYAAGFQGFGQLPGAVSLATPTFMAPPPGKGSGPRRDPDDESGVPAQSTDSRGPARLPGRAFRLQIVPAAASVMRLRMTTWAVAL